MKERYIAFLSKYLSAFPDALLWVLGYAAYVHAIDDIIDRDVPTDKSREEFILQTFEFAAVIYSNEFYIRNMHILYPLVKLASNTYMDSVQMEHEPELWKRRVADGLRQTGNEIIVAVIEICSGPIVRREASMELREISYNLHHDYIGNPI